MADRRHELSVAHAVALGTIEGRDALIDVLVALRAHRDALVVIGSQAVYEHTKTLSQIEPTSTNEGDLAVDPTLVAGKALILDSMEAAGWFLASAERSGIYSKSETLPNGSPIPPTVDLIAPEVLAGEGSRGARMGVHGKRAVGRAEGIEMAMLDRSPMVLGPIGDSDRRPVEVNVAGVAALLCAKAWKLAERFVAADAGRPKRLLPKDAGDVWRLMAVSDPTVVRSVFECCEADPRFGRSASKGRCYLLELFGPGGRGVELAVDALSDSLAESEVRFGVEGWIRDFGA